jgi:hypothetical protein
MENSDRIRFHFADKPIAIQLEQAWIDRIVSHEASFMQPEMGFPKGNFIQKARKKVGLAGIGIGKIALFSSSQETKSAN